MVGTTTNGLVFPHETHKAAASICFIVSDSNAIGRACLLCLVELGLEKQASTWSQSSWGKFPPPWVEVNPDDLLRNNRMAISKLRFLPVNTLFCPRAPCLASMATKGEGKGGEGGQTNTLPLPFRSSFWKLVKDGRQCSLLQETKIKPHKETLPSVIFWTAQLALNSDYLE